MNNSTQVINEHWQYIAELRAQLAERENAIQREVYAERMVSDGLRKQLAERDARIAELEAAQRWISVDERLPEPLTDVLVTDGEPVVALSPSVTSASATIGWASKHGAWNVNGWSSDGVTHWMPLPPPPATDVTP